MLATSEYQREEIEQIKTTHNIPNSTEASGGIVAAKRLVIKAAVFGFNKFVNNPSLKQFDAESDLLFCFEI